MTNSITAYFSVSGNEQVFLLSRFRHILNISKINPFSLKKHIGCIIIIKKMITLRQDTDSLPFIH
jgi:hypothetical protein